MRSILICDDDENFAAELAEALGARGFAVRTICSIGDIGALATPAVLLLDICMPKQDGIEALALIAEHPQKNLLDIVLVSGWDETMLSMAAKLCTHRGLRFLAALGKPVALGRLIDILRTGQPLNIS